LTDPATFKRSKLSAEQLDVARRLRAIRKKEGFSLDELGRESHLSKSGLANWEYGLAPLSFAGGNQICRRLNLNQRWLSTGKEPARPFADPLDLSASQDQIKAAEGLDFHGAYTGPLWAAMEKWHDAHPIERIVEETIRAGLPEAARRMSVSHLEAFAAEQFSNLRRTPEELKMQYLELFRGVILAELERRYSPKKRVDHNPTLWESTPVQIAEQLASTRARLRLTQEEAAKKWGVPLKTLQSWEQGARKPSRFACRQLETILRNENQQSG
jgi:DNA-binding transcriptional regulator YiaG